MTQWRLPEITYPLVVDTIGKMIALGEDLSVYCNNHGCHRGQRVNLAMLAHRVGMAFPSDARALKPMFFCSLCRDAGRPDRNISFIIAPCTVPHSGYPRRTADV